MLQVRLSVLDFIPDGQLSEFPERER